MNPPAPITAYTDSPPQRANLFPGAAQLLFWLFFHPSAYRNHINRITPGLRPDFALVELKPEQWRNPALMRLILQGYVLWPLAAAATAGGILGAMGMDSVNIVYSVLVGLSAGLTAGLAVGVAINVPAGIALSIVVTLAGGVVIYVTNGVAGSVAVYIIASGIAGSVALGILAQDSTYALSRKIGGVVVGVMIGLGAVVVSFGLSVVSAAATAFVIAGNLNLTGISDGPAGLAAFAVAGGVPGAAAGAVAFGVRIRKWTWGAGIGLLVGGGMGAAVQITSGGGLRAVAVGAMVGLLLGALFVLPYLLAARTAGPWAGAVAGGLGGGGGMIAFLLSIGRTFTSPIVLAGMLGLLPGLALHLWLPAALYPFLLVWDIALLRLDERRSANRSSLLRRHSAFWDEHQRLPMIGLEEHLVLVMERRPDEGRAAIEYLAAGRQRWAAQAAQIELDARGLERCGDVNAIKDAHSSLAAGELEGPASALLRSFSRVSQDVGAALQQESAYNQRLALSAVEDRLDGLLRELTRSGERYAARFRPIASRWRGIVADHMRLLAETVEQRQEIDSPYVIGVPLTEQQEIFVGRTDISARIEQLLLDRRRPPLLLYGQRRMGKTSLLNNLGRLLPSTLVPLFVDLQGPASRASDHAGFLYNIGRAMADSASRQRDLTLPPLARESLAADPFTHFDEWLDEVETALGEDTALLALDEFEVLDNAIDTGRFDEVSVMGMLRNLIQHRPKFKVLLAGSHTLDEVHRWASYLINVQVVQIGYLSEAESKQLIERPTKDFALRYEPEASQRVLALTRGHPFLTQLLCAEIVALKNSQAPAARRLAALADVDAAASEALNSGSFFFADIERNQVDEDGLGILRALAAKGENGRIGREAAAAPSAEALIRRDLIEPADAGYRFQVELIRRWFAR